MNVVEEGLEGFVDHVCVVIFKLLCSLYGHKIVEKSGEAVNLILIIPINAVPQIIRMILNLKTHIAANAPAFGSQLQMPIHLKDGIRTRFDANISEDAVFGVKQFAEAFEK